MRLIIFLWGLISLIKIGDRDYKYDYFPDDVKAEIESNTIGYSDEQIIKYSLDLTSKLLMFSEKNCLEKGEANCVGYAVLCSNICNYALSINNSTARTKPVVGYIKICGINICDLAQSLVSPEYKNFVKDHDFVEYYKEGQESTFFDPSLYDYSNGIIGIN